MSRPIPVSPERWAEMVQAWAENARLKAELTNCQSEADRLKAEVERLTDENVLIRMERMQDETGKRITYADYAELKAEVERLRASSFVTAVPVEQYEKLKAEVERLRKAGDALEQEVIGCYFEQDDPADSESLRAWRAAKEGKPSV